MPKTPVPKTEAFVKWFRAATPYIHRWGGATFVIGPEGGLSERERALAIDRGFESVALGPRVLRTETAPLAALAALHALSGDFRS